MTTSVEHQYKEMTVDTASSPPKMAGNPIAGFLFQVAMLSSLLCSSNGHGLKMGFYKQSCPQAETIVRTTVDSFFSHDPTVSAPLLRLHFHDCFVRGCDGSVLLNSTRKNLAEKDAKPNLTLDGFYVIDAAKAALEESCPATVSCADILALAARDAVSLAAGLGKGIAMTNQSLYQVETGRRDGFVSRASEAEAHLPSSYANISALKANFGSKRLTARDLAILSGAHAIGNSHCFSFDKRLKRYHGKGGIDPTLDPHYAIKLISKCRPSNGTTTEMVPGSSTTFDTKYYELVAKRRGLFHSDAALLHDKVTRDYVFSRLKSPESSFFADFGSAMVKMGKVGVLTGKAGVFPFPHLSAPTPSLASMASSTASRWFRPEVYPLFAAVGVAVGICGFQLIRNICINPEVRINKEGRAAGVLENYAEGEKYAEHSLRRFVRNRNPEIMPAINSFFTNPSK